MHPKMGYLSLENMRGYLPQSILIAFKNYILTWHVLTRFPFTKPTIFQCIRETEKATIISRTDRKIKK